MVVNLDHLDKNEAGLDLGQLTPGQLDVERKLLSFETNTEALNSLVQDANQRFMPDHWLCADFVTNSVRKYKGDTESIAKFYTELQTFMSQMERFNAAVKGGLSFEDFSHKLGMDIPSYDMNRLNRLNPKYLIEELASFVISDPAKLGLALLYAQAKEGGSRADAFERANRDILFSNSASDLIEKMNALSVLMA